MENVPQYYAAADLFLSASQSETQGLTYFEALAPVYLYSYKKMLVSTASSTKRMASPFTTKRHSISG